MRNIKQIIVLETFLVRHPVLRAEKPVASCRFDNNNLETRLLDSDYLLGVVSLSEAKNDSSITDKQF